MIKFFKSSQYSDNETDVLGSRDLSSSLVLLCCLIVLSLLNILIAIIFAYIISLCKVPNLKDNYYSLCVFLGSFGKSFIILEIISMIGLIIDYSINNFSKKRLHYIGLSFDTSKYALNGVKIKNPQALSILTELNNKLIPTYLENTKIYNKFATLKPLSYQDKQTKQNEINQTKNILNDLKLQILSKLQQIRDILDHEHEDNDHKKFMNQYQNIKKDANKLNH